MSGIPPKHILVFIPGFMGSQLRSRSTGELIWLDVPAFMRDPFQLQEKLHEIFEQLKYPNDDLAADGIVNQIMFFPPLFKQDEYSRFLRTLTSWGYVIPGEKASADQKPAYIFPYDWRQDNRLSARQLALAIKGWRSHHPEAQIWIVAHSNGGIVARWYIENEGGKDLVSKLFLIGSPWDGAPKSLEVLLNGVDWFLLRALNRFGLQKWIHEAAITFPCFYQLIPGHLPFLRDEKGKAIDIFNDPVLPASDIQNSLMRNASVFNMELGVDLSVETYCFFGIKQPTTSQGTVKRSPRGNVLKICWLETEDGDGTIPVHSGLHPQAKERLPFSAGHGDLYTNRALLDKLHFELVLRYRYGLQAKPPLPKFQAQFKTANQVYSPGETIDLQVNLRNELTGLPVSDAQVEVLLLYRHSVIKSAPPPNCAYENIEVVSGNLEPSTDKPGEYHGNITAPVIEGYYQLRVRFFVSMEPPFEIQDLILIEPQN